MGVIFSGEDGMRHCQECDSPELSPCEINPYGVCFGCADGDPDAGKPEPPSAATERITCVDDLAGMIDYEIMAEVSRLTTERDALAAENAVLQALARTAEDRNR